MISNSFFIPPIGKSWRFILSLIVIKWSFGTLHVPVYGWIPKNNLYKIQDGDEIVLDLKNAELSLINCNLDERVPIDIFPENEGIGRELFKIFRTNVGPVNEGASIFYD